MNESDDLAHGQAETRMRSVALAGSTPSALQIGGHRVAATTACTQGYKRVVDRACTSGRMSGRRRLKMDGPPEIYS